MKLEFWRKYLSWSKVKRRRFDNRWCQWLLHQLKKPPVEDFAGYDVHRRLQIYLNKRMEK